MLGIREPEHYGTQTLADLVQMIETEAAALGVTVECFQSNHEGVLVDRIQEAYGKADGILINPAAYTFRKISYIRQACIATVKGKGFEGYLEGLNILVHHLRQK